MRNKMTPKTLNIETNISPTQLSLDAKAMFGKYIIRSKIKVVLIVLKYLFSLSVICMGFILSLNFKAPSN